MTLRDTDTHSEPCPGVPGCTVPVCLDPRCGCRDHWHKKVGAPLGEPDAGRRGD